jgi:hypothetical protein
MAQQITFPQRPVEYTFSNSNTVTITHNKGYIPEVQVVLSSGEVVQADIRHTSVNEVVVTFVNAISGWIYIR